MTKLQNISQGKKKVLLIAPLSEQYSGIRNWADPCLGVYRISSFLRSKGHYTMVYDCNIHGSIDNFLIEEWDIIGISILNDTLILSLEMFLKLEKQCPKSLLIAGGAESTLNYQEIFENTSVNIVVIGEGELPLLEICNEEKQLHEIDGLILRKPGKPINDDLLWEYYKNIDFSEMGYREYWALDKDVYRTKTLRLVTSSHCLRGCDFCSLTKMHKFACGQTVKPAILSGNQIRILIDRALEQIPELEYIYFCEDSILPTLQRIDDFCEGLLKYKGRLKFLVQTETDKLDYGIIKKLASTDVVHITIGIENASENVRKFMGKKQNSEKIENIIEWCNEFNITCYYLIILFYPNSTIEDLVINYNVLSKWIDSNKVTLSIEPFAMPYRGANLYTRDFEFGYKFHTLSNKRIIKRPYIVYPRDKEVNQIMADFRIRMSEYLDIFNKKAGHRHRSKNYTSPVYVELLGDLLRKKGYIK